MTAEYAQVTKGLVDEEEGVATQLDGLVAAPDESVVTNPASSHWNMGKKGVFMVFALVIVGFVAFHSSTQLQPQRTRHGYQTKSFFAKLHRAHRIISLMQNQAPPSQAELNTETVLEDVGEAVEKENLMGEMTDLAEEPGEGISDQLDGPLMEVDDLGLTELQLQQFTEMFNSIDTNQDGQMTKLELGTAMIGFATTEQELPPPQSVIDDTFAEPRPEREAPEDAISFKEFANFQAEMSEGEGEEDEENSGGGLNRDFDLADVDNDGELSSAELYGFLLQTIPIQEIPVGMTLNDIVAMVISFFDKNEDGSLNKNELKAMLIATE